MSPSEIRWTPLLRKIRASNAYKKKSERSNERCGEIRHNTHKYTHTHRERERERERERDGGGVTDNTKHKDA
jgi:hypothetical protein